MSQYSVQLLTHSPVLFWPLEDVSVAAGAIQQLGSHAGTHYNGGVNTVAPTLGVAGPLVEGTSLGMTFNGTTQFLDMGNSVDRPDAGPDGTWIVWGNGGTVAGYAYSGATGGANNLLTFTMGNSGQVACSTRISGGASNRATYVSTDSFSNVPWTMYAIVTNNAGASKRIYVNGVEVAGSATDVVGAGDDGDWWQTMSDTGASWFHTIGGRRIVAVTLAVPYGGSLSHVSYHSTELSAAQLLALYEKATILAPVPAANYRRQNRHIYV